MNKLETPPKRLLMATAETLLVLGVCLLVATPSSFADTLLDDDFNDGTLGTNPGIGGGFEFQTNASGTPGSAVETASQAQILEGSVFNTSGVLSLNSFDLSDPGLTYTVTWEVAGWVPSSDPPSSGTNDIRRLQLALQSNGGFLFAGGSEESRLVAIIHTSSNQAVLEYINTSGGAFQPTLRSAATDLGEFDGDMDGFTVTLVLDSTGYSLTTVGLDAPNQADVSGTWDDLGTSFETVLGTDGPVHVSGYIQDLAITGAALNIDRITLNATAVSDTLALTGFSYDPSTGDSQVSIEGSPSTGYILVEAAGLDFAAPDQSPVPLTGATVGSLAGNQVITDSSGSATVQFNLGTGQSATFIRAEDAPPLFEENFDDATALPAGWVSSGPDNGTDWQVGIPSGVPSGPAAAVSEPNCAGTNIGGYYTENTSVSLTTPSIAIPPDAGATLSFQHLIDTDAAGDAGSVFILDADNGDLVISGFWLLDLQGQGSQGAGWTEGTIVLPAGDFGGKNIKVRFGFVSDAGTVADIDVFGGFYIDDVVVALN